MQEELLTVLLFDFSPADPLVLPSFPQMNDRWMRQLSTKFYGGDNGIDFVERFYFPFPGDRGSLRGMGTSQASMRWAECLADAADRCLQCLLGLPQATHVVSLELVAFN